MSDASGGAGNGWDLISVTGSTLIGGTPGDTIILDLTSLSGTLPGEAQNFDAAQDYTWELLSSPGGLLGFDEDAFTLLTSNFQNDLAGGSFFLAQQGNSLNLVFDSFAETSSAAIPEPSTLALLSLGALAAFPRRRRRLKQPLAC